MKTLFALFIILSVSVAYAKEPSNNDNSKDNSMSVQSSPDSQDGKVDDGSPEDDSDPADVAMDVAQDQAVYESAVMHMVKN